MAVFEIWSDEGNTADNARSIDRFAYTGYVNKSDDVDWLKLNLTPGTYQISVLPDLAEVTYDPSFAYLFGAQPGAPILWQETVVGANLYQKITSKSGVSYSSVGAFFPKNDDLAVTGRTLSTGNRIEFKQGTFEIKSPSVSGDVQFTGEYFLEITGSAVPLLNDGLADIYSSGKFSNNAGRYLVTLGNPTGQRQEYWGGNWIDSNNFQNTNNNNTNTNLPEIAIDPSKLPPAAQWKVETSSGQLGRVSSTSPEYHFDEATGKWYAPGPTDLSNFVGQTSSDLKSWLGSELDRTVWSSFKKLAADTANSIFPGSTQYAKETYDTYKKSPELGKEIEKYTIGKKFDRVLSMTDEITIKDSGPSKFDGETTGKVWEKEDESFLTNIVKKNFPKNSFTELFYKGWGIYTEHSDISIKNTFDIVDRPQVYNAPAGHKITYIGSALVDVVSGGDGGAFLYGGGGNDTLSGGQKADVILGGAGDDQINGGGGDDRLWGNDGNDRLTGGAGNDLLVGGAGSDTAVYSQSASAYVIKFYVDSGSKFSWQVLDRVAGRDGQDKLQSIEKLQFTDGTAYLEVPAKASLFGTMLYEVSGVGGQVYSLYDGILGRAPDLLGLQAWTDLVNRGADIKSLANAFFGSPEGQARASALDNGAFVEQLYTANLHRSSDAGGLQWWVDNLNQGVSRGDVAASFALSAEHMENLAGTFSGGIFVPDLNATSVARLYYAVLNRSPDAGGLTYWTNQVKNGASLENVTQSFLTAPEVVSKTGNLSSSQYVDFIYLNALGRHAEPGGLAYWTDLLNQGQSRVGVTTTIGLSSEAQQRHLTQIESEWQLA